MSELRLNLLDARNAINGTIHGSVADAVIAALSAEPETIGELEAALERFNKRIDDHAPFAWFTVGENTEPWDAGVIVVDLAGRIVASESSYSAILAHGEVAYHDGTEATDTWLLFHLPDDWLLLTSILEYEALRDVRRAARLASPPIDVREILYGRPIFEFIVDECLTEYAKLDRLAGSLALDGNDECDGSPQVEAVVRAVHSRWLMTSRNELRGRTPREVILEKREFIALEIDSRAMQWSLLNEAPPALSRDSHAYRFAGFGTHEYVINYDFVRNLLRRCWERIGQELSDKNSRPDVDSGSGLSIAVEPFLAEHPRWRAALVAWLEQVGRDWLNNANEDLDGRVPAAIIESERRRIPLVMSAKDIMVDENCGLCRMLADEAGHGPTFWLLDGSHMDQAFEFSSYLTREEYEAEQRRWQEINDEFKRNWSAEHPKIDEDADLC